MFGETKVIRGIVVFLSDLRRISKKYISVSFFHFACGVAIFRTPQQVTNLQDSPQIYMVILLVFFSNPIHPWVASQEPLSKMCHSKFEELSKIKTGVLKANCWNYDQICLKRRIFHMFFENHLNCDISKSWFFFFLTMLWNSVCHHKLFGPNFTALELA